MKGRMEKTGRSKTKRGRRCLTFVRVGASGKDRKVVLYTTYPWIFPEWDRGMGKGTHWAEEKSTFRVSGWPLFLLAT
jgi:hypothetical protein